jgi:disulfide bond formation protein DsbB
MKKATSKLQNIQGFVTYFIFLQAFVAMLGSLYYSTFGDPVKNVLAGYPFPIGQGFTPCELCWFARILMYPIVAISAVGMVKEDRKFTNYVLPLSILGIILDFFHYGLQKLGFVNPFGCTLANPCSALQVQYFGFITIPFLALVAFIVITFLSLVNVWINRQIDTDTTSAD